MQILKGMTWDHSRGFDPMVASAKKFNENHLDIQIIWEKRSLKASLETWAFQFQILQRRFTN